MFIHFEKNDLARMGELRLLNVFQGFLRGMYFISDGSYLVDPASSHMLVSKIKPCMSKYKPLYGETANGSLNQKLFI